MVNVTYAVDDNVKHKMEHFRYVNWSAVAREAVEKRLHELEFLEEVTKKSELTEEDALEIGRKINKSMAARYRKLRK